MSSPSIPTLRLEHFAHGRAFYALLLELRSVQKTAPTFHTHDFYEVMLIRSGLGTHYVNGEKLPMRAGELLLVRPDDCHSVYGVPHGAAINVAFSAESWRRQSKILNLETHFALWESAPLPPTVMLEGEALARCSHAFESALAAGITQQRAAMGLGLMRLWESVIHNLIPGTVPETNADYPDWLARSLWLMEREENLHGGVPRLVELAAVCPEHLARVMRRDLGQTPTQWVNALRVQRAAGWLLGTQDGIETIAARCGLANLPHFYRLFTTRYGVPPRRYRLQERQKLSPDSSVRNI
ncbi:HTH-type transcriptional regulator ChbR [Abditibacteriota bacterium]|nr:HTH-type transcriptional regulator ChbR [Abditibacteriota bacterium]